MEGAREDFCSERIFGAGDWILFSVLSLLRIAAIGWFLFFWLFFPSWHDDALIFATTTLLLLVGLFGNQLRWISLPYMKRPLPVKAEPGLRVAAVTTCVPTLEPAEMVEATLRAMKSMDYPHDTWLLDEGDSSTMRDLCHSLGVRHFSRKDQPRYQSESGRFETHSKHGNYNAWLHEVGFAQYDYMLAFDPDHTPLPDYASSVLGHFQDGRVAYVQTPQVYRNQSASLVSRGAAEETYAYNSVTEMAAFSAGAPVLIGCHNAQRLAALRDFGGLPDHAAEDLLQTVYYRQVGWRGVYVPRVLATGLAPQDWPGYLTQQIRWSRSVLDIKFRHLSVPRQLRSVKSGIELLQGFGYLQDAVLALGTLTLLVTALVSGRGVATFDHLGGRPFVFLVAVIFLSDFFRQHFYLQPKIEMGVHWRAGLLRLAKWPFTVAAIWQVVRNRPFRYVVTPKVTSSPGRRRLLIPHGLIALLLIAAWVTGYRLGVPQSRVVELCAAVVIVLSITLILLESSTQHESR
jgi:cellulose synthase/poly-beta-1,6-N-acetylglucosamine synthase-like glycosyltransferase